VIWDLNVFWDNAGRAGFDLGSVAVWVWLNPPLLALGLSDAVDPILPGGGIGGAAIGADH
jgi:hypothetical protein